jgi:hypothetical protein
LASTALVKSVHTAAERVRAPRARGATFWATLGFLILEVGWLLVMPPFTGIDEFDHAFRASSVAAGHVRGDLVASPAGLSRGDLVPVRADVVRAAYPACSKLPYTRLFDCQPVKRLPSGEYQIGSAASRYNPAFYAYIGTVARPWHGNAALYAMRIAAVIPCAALFALSFHVTTRSARTRWPAALLLLGVLPTTTYSASLASPNGTQMMAGLAVWATLIAMVRTGRRTLLSYAGLGAAAAILANTHTLGLLWLLLVLIATLVWAGPRRLLALLWPSRPLEWVIASLTVLLVGFQLVWISIIRPNDISTLQASYFGHLWSNLPYQMLLWPLQAIGAFPFRDQPAPAAVYALAVALLLAVACLGVASAGVPSRLFTSMAFVAGASYCAPVIFTIVSFSRVGTSWQGRYGMPFTVGLILLFGVALDEDRRNLPAVALRLGLGALIVMQLSSQVGVLRYERSDTKLVSQTDWWASPTLLIVAVCLVAGAAWYVAAFRSVRQAPDLGITSSGSRR